MRLNFPLARGFVHICESLEVGSSQGEELLSAVFKMQLAPEPSFPALSAFRGCFPCHSRGSVFNKLLELEAWGVRGKLGCLHRGSCSAVYLV